MRIARIVFVVVPRERKTGDQKADSLAFITSPQILAANLYHRDHRKGATES
jgi:hypothetical protein